MEIKVSEVCTRRSYSFAKRRLKPSHAKLRSTIHVSPAIAKSRCLRLKTRNC